MDSNNLVLEVENVGGIEADVVEISPGITALSGENTTNRTSLMNSMMAALGSDEVQIRTGADGGYVCLEYDGDVYRREVEPTETGSVWSGEGVADNIRKMQLFSFLLRENDLRDAVMKNEGLYDLVMEPVDTQEIESEIEELKQRRSRIEEREEGLKDKRNKIQELKQEIETKKSEKEDFEQKLSDVESEIDEIDEQDTQNDKLEESRDLNSQIKDLSDKASKIEDEIEVLEERLSNREEELEELKSTDFEDPDELREEVSELKSDISDIEDEISDLESDKRKLTPFRTFLSQLTGDDTSPSEINRVFGKYTDEVQESNEQNSDPTAALLADSDSTQCILCGGDVEADHYQQLNSKVHSAISEITSKIEELSEEADSLRDKKKDMEEAIADIRQNQGRIDDLESEMTEIESDIQSKRDELEDVTDQKESVEQELDDIQDEVVEDTEDKTSELRELEREKTQLEIDIEDAAKTIESNEEKISELKSEIDEIEAEVEEAKPEIKTQLEELRGKVEAIESAIVEEFNSTMEEIIDRLGYDKIERVWIERKVKEVKEGRSKREKTFFDLNIARNVDGVTTNEVIDNLSESEQTVTSLVFAFSGYLVHDVDDEFPIMMLDSVEMIDAQRLESLLDYMGDRVEYLVTTTLPEDTEVMDIDAVIRREASKAA